MKINVIILTLFFLIFTLFYPPFNSEAAFPTPTPTPNPPPTAKAVEINLQNALGLNEEATQKLEEEKYSEVPPIINNTIDSLNAASDNLKTDPELEDIRDNRPKEISKIDRLIQSSIKAHKKAILVVNRIITSVDESVISKLKNKAKRALFGGRIFTQRASTAVCTVS